MQQSGGATAIADALNELKSTTWVKNVALQYLHLCKMLLFAPTPPKVRILWFKSGLP